MYPFIVTLSELINLCNLVLTAWVVLSMLIYFNIVNRYQPFVAKLNQVLSRLVEPLLRPIRKYLPDFGGVDVSPIVLFLLLDFLKRALWYYFG